MPLRAASSYVCLPRCSPERSSVDSACPSDDRVGSRASASAAAVDLNRREPWHQTAGFKCSRGGTDAALWLSSLRTQRQSAPCWVSDPWPFTSTCYASFLPLWNGTNRSSPLRELKKVPRVTGLGMVSFVERGEMELSVWCPLSGLWVNPAEEGPIQQEGSWSLQSSW